MVECSYCGEDIEDWADNNTDADGNQYCMNCVSKVELVMEEEDEE